jgi:hypothetical protein
MVGDGDGGFVKIYRSIWQHPRASNPSWLAVWVWLLSHAAYQEREAIWCGKKITLQPGQIVTGSMKIGRATGVPASTVRRILKMLNDEGEVEQQTSNASSLISVTNWFKFQSVSSGWAADEQRDVADMHTECSPSEQRMGSGKASKSTPKGGSEKTGEQRMSSGWAADEQRVSTYKEGKKERSKEEKKKGTAASPLAEFESALGLAGSAELLEVYRDWLNYRQTEQGKPVTARSAGVDGKRCAEMAAKGIPPRRVVDMFRLAMDAGWRGWWFADRVEVAESLAGSSSNVFNFDPFSSAPAGV